MVNKINVKYDREHDFVTVWVSRHGKSGYAGYGTVGDVTDAEFEDVARMIVAAWFVPLAEDLISDLKGPIRDAVRRGRADG